MPELPEVETIRRVLEPQLQNRTIEKVTVNHKDAVAYPSMDDFCLGLSGCFHHWGFVMWRFSMAWIRSVTVTKSWHSSRHCSTICTAEIFQKK